MSSRHGHTVARIVRLLEPGNLRRSAGWAARCPLDRVSVTGVVRIQGDFEDAMDQDGSIANAALHDLRICRDEVSDFSEYAVTDHVNDENRTGSGVSKEGPV